MVLVRLLSDLSFPCYSFRFGDESGDVYPSPGRALAVPPKERKKWDRFNGMSVDEVKQRTLPDHLAPNLDIVIVSVYVHF
jgi:hypothetical protein